ncbi:MAG: hypothetical protein KUG81_02335 [Gammaproteobacteria bacterium]|nr:hypothetical protein [Gammaproteobacteria bacterium]
MAKVQGGRAVDASRLGRYDNVVYYGAGGGEVEIYGPARPILQMTSCSPPKPRENVSRGTRRRQCGSSRAPRQDRWGRRRKG